MIAPSPQVAQNSYEYDPIQLRFDMNWTLTELAQNMGASVSTVRKWSTNRRNPCSMARRLAWYLKQELSACSSKYQI